MMLLLDQLETPMLGYVIMKDDVTGDGGGVPGVAKAKWGGIFSCWNSCLME